MAASTYSLFRLRGMLNKSNKRLRRSVQAVYDKQEVIHQLQEQAKVLSRKADQVEGLTSDLSVTKTSLAAKSGELTEVQEKLNENYRLVAKLSSENLKLSGEKVKADQLVAQVIQEQVLQIRVYVYTEVGIWWRGIFELQLCLPPIQNQGIRLCILLCTL